MAAVARALRRRQRLRRLDREAVPLPVREPTHERGDVSVPELAQRLGREGRARAARAVDDELALLVGHEALDPRLELAAGDVDGAGNGALVPLVLLAHVHEQRRRRALARVGRPDLVDLALDLGEQLAV